MIEKGGGGGGGGGEVVKPLVTCHMWHVINFEIFINIYIN
jgi:hypothetical protein